MSKDFSSDTGGIQSSNSTIFSEKEAGVSKSGIDEAPASELAPFGAGPGIGSTGRGIH